MSKDNTHHGRPPLSGHISYHKENYTPPLNAVKEDVEAEAAEAVEDSTNFHSLDFISVGHSSLSSSVVSSVSLEDGYFNYERLGLRYHPVSLSNQDINHVNGNQYTHTGQQEYRHKHAVNIGDVEIAEQTGARFSPSIPQKGRNLRRNGKTVQVNQLPVGNSKIMSKSVGSDKARTPNEKKNPVWHNPSKSDGLQSTEKEGSGILRGELRLKIKCEKDETSMTDSRLYNSLPRKKKEKSAKDIAAETYGTLGRNRRCIKDTASSIPSVVTPRTRAQSNNSSAQILNQDTKNTLDKYATLPRRKAKEMSARWREQMKSTDQKDGSTSSISKLALQRSKSTGKNDSVKAAASASNSPRVLGTSKQPSFTRLQDKGKNISPSARLLAKQHLNAKDRPDKSPSPTINSLNKPPKLSKPIKRKNIGLQVDVKWDPDENELHEKMRKMTEEMTGLQTRLTQAEADSKEVEQLRMEADVLRRSVESERLEKEELQEELDKTSGKVRDMLTSMEGVEKEFNHRGDSLIELENQLHSSSDINIRMQERINQYEEYAIKLHNDMEKSMAAQKTLLQQVQDLEAEGREMADFMAEEKNALSECLKEVECELSRTRQDRDMFSSRLRQKDEEARHMVRLAEERRREIFSLQSEVANLSSRNQELMVGQGAEVSGVAIGIAHLIIRLRTVTDRLIKDYSISEDDIQNVATPSSTSNSLPSSANQSPVRSRSSAAQKTSFSACRRLSNSQNISRPVSFMQSFLNAIGQAGDATKKIKARKTGRKSPDGSEHSSYTETNQTEQSSLELLSPSFTLVDQVTEVDNLLTRLLKVSCVLKSDADLILTQLEEENERICNQLSVQQHMIESHYSECGSDGSYKSATHKEVLVISKEIEGAQAALERVCKNVSPNNPKKVIEDLLSLDKALLRIHDLHSERSRRMHILMDYRLPISDGEEKLLKSPKEGCNESLSLSELEDRDGDEMEALVGHILKTLESIPDVVSACPALKDLYVTLSCPDEFLNWPNSVGKAWSESVPSANPKGTDFTGGTNGADHKSFPGQKYKSSINKHGERAPKLPQLGLSLETGVETSVDDSDNEVLNTASSQERVNSPMLSAEREHDSPASLEIPSNLNITHYFKTNFSNPSFPPLEAALSQKLSPDINQCMFQSDGGTFESHLSSDAGGPGHYEDDFESRLEVGHNEQLSNSEFSPIPPTVDLNANSADFEIECKTESPNGNKVNIKISPHGTGLTNDEALENNVTTFDVQGPLHLSKSPTHLDGNLSHSPNKSVNISSASSVISPTKDTRNGGIAHITDCVDTQIRSVSRESLHPDKLLPLLLYETPL